MRVRLERSGGVAGMRRSFAVDSDALAPTDAAALHVLVDSADLDHVRQGEVLRPGQVDAFHYRLTIEQEGAQQTVSVGEEALTPQLIRLLDWLQQRG